MGEFAKLWAAYEYEYKTTVTADMVEMSAVVDRIVNKCHMAVIQVTGMHCFSWICFFFYRIIVMTFLYFIAASPLY